MKTVPNQGSVAQKVAAAMRKVPLFGSFGDDLIREASGLAQVLQLEPGEALYRQGEPPDGFFVVLSGVVRVLVVASGGEKIEVARFEPGQSVGLSGALLGRKYTALFESEAVSNVIKFDSQFLETMAARAPGFGLDVAKVLAERLAVAVDRIPIPDADPKVMPPTELLELLPREFMERHRLLPLSVSGDVLTVGFVDDPSPEIIQRLRTYVSAMELRIVRVDARRLNQALGSRVGKREGAAPGGSLDPALLDRLLRAMVSEGASDLHLAGGQRPRWRIDGDMREIEDVPPLAPDAVLELLASALPAMRHEEFTATNDTDFAHEIPGVARFRVNLFRDSGGIGAVLRRIPMSIVGLEQLSMPPAVASFCSLPKGLVLVTGPTGSGKSTTLAAMVDLINGSRKEHIITLEDPVEFVHASKKSFVNQREVGLHTQTFGRALRAALREDPDVVLVGEMRDLETVSLALETANTGHLVLATLHTATAISTIDRIVGLFPSEEQNRIRATLADVLKGVVSQNLLKRKGGGRVAAVEILVVNAAVANLIRETKTHMITSAMQTGKAAGNQLLNEALAKLVTEGKVEYEEALTKAVDKADLARRLHRPPVQE